MNRRERMLRELDLYPVWVRREGEVAPAPAASTDASAVQGTPWREVMPPSPPVPAPRSQPLAQARSTPPMVADAGHAGDIAGMDWTQLEQCIRDCAACPLHAKRKQAVPGFGDRAADWLFVGEGPGADEDERGEPFVGQAGRLLDNMLSAVGIARGHDVYIANVVKCRPPGNRTPEPLEAGACEPYLKRQIALIQPRLIVALGKTAADNLLRREAPIASLRGQVHDYNGIALIVTYHPAYLLRSLVDKAKAWEDLCLARDTMTRLKDATLNQEPAP